MEKWYQSKHTETHTHIYRSEKSNLWLIKILRAYFVKVLSTDPSAKKFGVKLNPGMSAESPARGIKPHWFSLPLTSLSFSLPSFLCNSHCFSLSLSLCINVSLPFLCLSLQPHPRERVQTKLVFWHKRSPGTNQIWNSIYGSVCVLACLTNCLCVNLSVCPDVSLTQTVYPKKHLNLLKSGLHSS